MGSAKTPTAPTIHHTHQHLLWSRHLAPVQIIASGDIVHFDALDASNGQITPSSTASSLSRFDVNFADPAFGPVYISGAEPGDVLQIEIIELQPSNWGWTAILPSFGLLSDEFPDPVLKIWKIDGESEYMYLTEKVRIRKRPFLGIIGVAPGPDLEDEEVAKAGGLSMIPPRDVGGNMDCRSLTVGTTLYLPIKTPGALFSCGDGHAAQGDGEVCGTAVETPMKATVRLTVLKDRPWITAPQFQSPPRSQADVKAEEDKGEYATMGIDADMREATRKATRSMIAWLVNTKGLTREEAYILASVAGNLRLAEVVDMPNYAVVMALPLNVFVE
ncbi:hypothetical protein VTO42DRAFT_1034 [Malbranchea cinnamomea]